MLRQYELGIMLYYICVLVTVHFTGYQFFMFRLNVRGHSDRLISYPSDAYKISPAQKV